MNRKEKNAGRNNLVVCFVILIFAGFYFYSSSPEQIETSSPGPIETFSTSSPAGLSVIEITEPLPTKDNAIRSLYTNQQSNVQVTGSGIVERILSDDNDGSRHQRFILRLSSGQTILITHNIDLAPRIGSLSNNDSVIFNGEYEWNSQGGVVHWTHKDPNGRHVNGSLIHKGRTYQ